MIIMKTNTLIGIENIQNMDTGCVHRKASHWAMLSGIVVISVLGKRPYIAVKGGNK
jgi:DNA integrity scanning protein DisA with diadenylate cyclase activity